MSEVRGLFFEIENDHGIKVDVLAGFFSVPRGSWKIIPGSGKRGKRTLEDIKKGDKVVYIGRKSSQKHLNQAHANAKGMTLSHKYFVSRVIDLSDEEDHQNSVIEGMLRRGW